MPLTDVKIRNVKPRPGKSGRLYDERGLYLEVAPSGGKWWRWKYRYAGKEKRLSLGVFPDVSLKDARNRRDEARKLLANGVDPSRERQAAKAALTDENKNTFSAIAHEWHQKRSDVLAPAHATRIWRLLERDVLPFIGGRAISQIEAPELLAVLRRIEERGVRVTTRRALVYCRMVFAYAVACGRSKRNVATDLRGALAPVRAENFPAITNPKEFGNLLRALDGYQGSFTVQCALKLAPMLVVRPGELRHAKWVDFDLDSATWSFVASKTKTPHIVPLSKQAVAILMELRKFTGTGEYVFPSARSSKRPMSDAAVLAAMRRMEIPADEMVGHGFRSSFRTLASEVLRLKPELLEMQLAHRVKNPLGRAYDRAEFLPARRRMMQRWSDYCEALRDGGKVIVGNSGGGVA